MHMFKRVAMATALTSVTAMAAIPAVSSAQTGYPVKICNAPSTGIAIRQGDSDGTTQVGRVYNGSAARVYATHAGQPSISDGWAAGYGHDQAGNVIHGYFKLAYTCAP